MGVEDFAETKTSDFTPEKGDGSRSEMKEADEKKKDEIDASTREGLREAVKATFGKGECSPPQAAEGSPNGYHCLPILFLIKGRSSAF